MNIDHDLAFDTLQSYDASALEVSQKENEEILDKNASDDEVINHFYGNLSQTEREQIAADFTGWKFAKQLEIQSKTTLSSRENPQNTQNFKILRPGDPLWHDSKDKASDKQQKPHIITKIIFIAPSTGHANTRSDSDISNNTNVALSLIPALNESISINKHMEVKISALGGNILLFIQNTSLKMSHNAYGYLLSIDGEEVFAQYNVEKDKIIDHTYLPCSIAAQHKNETLKVEIARANGLPFLSLRNPTIMIPYNSNPSFSVLSMHNADELLIYEQEQSGMVYPIQYPCIITNRANPNYAYNHKIFVSSHHLATRLLQLLPFLVLARCW